jgi:hypothetical protein
MSSIMEEKMGDEYPTLRAFRKSRVKYRKYRLRVHPRYVHGRNFMSIHPWFREYFKRI